MATLTNNTAGSLKKMWPPIKRKGIEAHESFATFLGSAPVEKKRKAVDEGEDADDLELVGDPPTAGDKAEPKKKTAAPKAKGRPKRQAKKEATSEDEVGPSIKETNPDKPAEEKKAPAAKAKGRPTKQMKEAVSEDEANNQAEVNSMSLLPPLPRYCG